MPVKKDYHVGSLEEVSRKELSSGDTIWVGETLEDIECFAVIGDDKYLTLVGSKGTLWGIAII